MTESKLKLPKIPSGYRWKIVEPFAGAYGDMVKVKLQKKTWFFWVTVASQMAYNHRDIDAGLPDVVSETANEIYDRYLNPTNFEVLGTYYGED
jgi:hypothetical protein